VQKRKGVAVATPFLLWRFEKLPALLCYTGLDGSHSFCFVAQRGELIAFAIVPLYHISALAVFVTTASWDLYALFLFLHYTRYVGSFLPCSVQF
jgi:hypothetical protein